MLLVLYCKLKRFPLDTNKRKSQCQISQISISITNKFKPYRPYNNITDLQPYADGSFSFVFLHFMKQARYLFHLYSMCVSASCPLVRTIPSFHNSILTLRPFDDTFMNCIILTNTCSQFLTSSLRDRSRFVQHIVLPPNNFCVPSFGFLVAHLTPIQQNSYFHCFSLCFIIQCCMYFAHASSETSVIPEHISSYSIYKLITKKSGLFQI